MSRRTVNLKLDQATFDDLETVATYNRLRRQGPDSKQGLIEQYIATGLAQDAAEARQVLSALLPPQPEEGQKGGTVYGLPGRHNLSLADGS